jgi:hypothetical protein
MTQEAFSWKELKQFVRQWHHWHFRNCRSSSWPSIWSRHSIDIDRPVNGHWNDCESPSMCLRMADRSNEGCTRDTSWVSSSRQPSMTGCFINLLESGQRKAVGGRGHDIMLLYAQIMGKKWYNDLDSKFWWGLLWKRPDAGFHFVAEVKGGTPFGFIIEEDQRGLILYFIVKITIRLVVFSWAFTIPILYLEQDFAAR